jgi:cytochrome oxidase Cu insertion factor (SCO1/SenC/PrrC family)
MLGRGADGKKFLQAVLETNPGKDAKGMACYTLASQAASQAEREKDKEKAAAAEKDAIALFERVAKEFADVSYFGRSTLGEQAAGDLFALKNLAPGKPVPEIEAEDTDGQKFKLSDYKGKVVLLDFWGHW